MLNNEEVMNALEKGEISVDGALHQLTGERATDGNGLAIGTVVAIRRPDPEHKGEYITEIRTAGFRDWDNTEAIEASDTFRIYSATKTFTADVIKGLHQQGKLALGDKLADWIQKIASKNIESGHPELNSVLEKLNIHPDATIQDLLQHTSGIGNYSQGAFFDAANSAPGKDWSLYDLFSYNMVVTEGADKNNAFGQFCYSDTGYNLLALICEHATGKTYEMMVQELCNAEDLHNTVFIQQTKDTESKDTTHIAHGYVMNPQSGTPTSSMNYDTSKGAGGLLSTAEDMLVWAKRLYSKNSVSLTDDKTIAVTGKTPSRCGEARYGNGIMVQENGSGQKLFGHGGYARGGRSKVYYYPDSDTSIVTLESFESIAPAIAKELVKEQPELGDVRQTTLLLRDLYTDASGKFNRARLLADWQKDRNVVVEKVSKKSVNKYDAIIIGAGVFGLSVADALTKAGKKVLVLEKNPEIAQGASNGYARMSKLDPRNPLFNQFVHDSQKIITTELETKPGEILHPVLCFDVCENDHPLRQVYSGLIEETPATDPQSRFGITTESGKELYGYTEQTYTVNPHVLIHALAKRCADAGSAIETNTEVTGWQKTSTGIVVTTATGSEYRADNIFIAAHGWSRALLEKGNISVHPSIGESVDTKRAPVWNFAWPKGMPLSIGRSSLPGKSYLDVYFLPEYLPDIGWTMKVGLNSDHDRNTKYSTPDQIYHSHNPAIATITPEETEQAKELVLQKFGIKLGEPLATQICCMTYPKQLESQGFSSMLLGPLIDTQGKVIDGVNAAFGGCGLLVKLSPAIGEVARIGLEKNWQGAAIFDEFSPARYANESKEFGTERAEQTKALFRAVQSGHIEELTSLIRESGLNPTDIRDQFNKTLLHYAAFNGHIKMFDHLVVTYGLGSSHKANNGATPIHEAAYSGHIEMFEHIVGKYGIDPSTYDSHHRNALRYAACNGKMDMAKHLIAKYKMVPYEPDNHGKTPLNYAIEYGHVKMTDYLVSVITAQNPDARHPCTCLDEHGKTFLHHAAFYGKREMFDHLVAAYNLAPSQPANNGATSLHDAAYNGQTEMVGHLITEYGLNTNICDKGGKTPFDYAVENGKEETAGLIQQHIESIKQPQSFIEKLQSQTRGGKEV